MKRSFKDFKSAINTILEEEVGLSCNDLPDYCYRDNYDNGITVEQTVSDSLDSAGYPG